MRQYPYLLPLVLAALEQLWEAKIFTKLDLCSAYNLVLIWEGDEWKTAFHTTRGHYEYLFMPYGLTNSPAVFQSFVNYVFKDLIDQCVTVYIDDILIFSSSYYSHVNHVRMVLSHLRQHQLYAKAEKCEFHKDSITFLRYIITQQGVEMDPNTVKVVMDWPELTNIKELQRGSQTSTIGSFKITAAWPVLWPPFCMAIGSTPPIPGSDGPLQYWVPAQR